MCLVYPGILDTPTDFAFFKLNNIIITYLLQSFYQHLDNLLALQKQHI